MKLRLLLVSSLLCLACVPAHAVYLDRLKMVSPSSGWAVGTLPGHYALYHTNDGGRQWADVSPPGFNRAALYDEDTEDEAVGCALPDAQQAWIAADEQSPDGNTSDMMHVWRTGDGGARWRESHFRTHMVGDSVYLQFLDHSHGVLLALGGPAAGLMSKEFYTTADGGQTWRHMTSPDSIMDDFYPTGMTFRTPTDGWIAAIYHGAADAPFLHTTDGGRRWQIQPFPLPADAENVYANTLPPVFFGRDRKNGLFIAEIQNSRIGTSLYNTQDGGRRWRRGGALPFGEGDDTDRAVSFVSPRQGWAADTRRHLSVTQDGGRTWQHIVRRFGPPLPTGEEAWEWTQLDFVSPQVGWALFQRRTEKTYIADLYQTQDGGYHWQHIQVGSTPNPVYVALHGSRSIP